MKNPFSEHAPYEVEDTAYAAVIIAVIIAGATLIYMFPHYILGAALFVTVLVVFRGIFIIIGKFLFDVYNLLKYMFSE